MTLRFVTVMAAGFIAAAAAGGCRSEHEAAVQEKPALAPVSLPDLARTETPVQQQLRERYAALTLKSGDSGTAVADLARAYGDMGQLLMAAEYLETAEACFLNAQVLAPGEVRWPYYLGHLYKTRGETAKSVASFERALQLQPGDVATLVWLGNAYVDQDRAESAEPLFTKALSLQPQSSAALYGLGRAALAKRNFADAVARLERALALNPRASAVQYPLGLAYRGLGETDKAEAHLRQRGDGEAVPADPLMDELRAALHSVVEYENRGLRALNSGDYTAAASYFRQGLALAPDNPSLRYGLGTALAVTGDAQGALAEFTETVRRSPGFAKAHFSLGVLSASKGRLEEAIDQFSAVVKAEPDHPGAELQLAEALRRSGRGKESLSHYGRALALDPRSVEASFGYATALVRLNRYQEAREKLVDGMTLQPDQPAIAQALVRLLAAAPDDRVRDGRKAMALMQELLKKPHNVDLNEAMAMTLAELGQYDDAVTWQQGVMAAASRGGRPDLVERMAENLKLYQSHLPCRTPWREDDARTSAAK